MEARGGPRAGGWAGPLVLRLGRFLLRFSLAFSFSPPPSPSFSSVATISATWLVEMWTPSLSTSSMTCAQGRGRGAQAALPLTGEALRAQPAGDMAIGQAGPWHCLLGAGVLHPLAF